MDMRKFAGEQFIKVDDVRDGPLEVQIALIKAGKYDKPDMVFESGEILTLNATNVKTLMRAYGPNSDDWIGKNIELALGQIEFQKKMQEAVVVKPISPPIAAAVKAAAAKQMGGDMNDEIPF